MLTDPMPVRLSEEQDQGLNRISSATGMSKAELMRIAVDEFVRRAMQTGEIVTRHTFAVGDNIAIGNTGKVSQKKKSTGTSTSSARSQKAASAAEVGNKREKAEKLKS